MASPTSEHELQALRGRLCRQTLHAWYEYPAEFRLSPAAFLTPLSPGRIRQLLEDERKLCGWISAFYDGGAAYGGRGESSRYQALVDGAIAADDIESLEALWQGARRHDQAGPAYGADLLTAARRGNLATFRHALYAYHHDATGPLEPVSADDLLREAANNGPVRRWITAKSADLRRLQGGAAEDTA